MTTPNRPPGAAAYFGDRADLYDTLYDAFDADGHALRARLAAALGLIGSGPGKLLDAGMGPGRLCAEAAAVGWTVSGVDPSPQMVEAARARLPSAEERLRCAPIESLPFPSASFDVVSATGVLEYSDVPAALAELSRVLRPGGRAVVSYPNPHALYGIWKTRLWYPLMRGAKRILRRPNPQMPHGAGELAPPLFVAALRRAGLEPGTLLYTSYIPVVTPIERLLPRTTARLGQRLEGARRSASVLATQIVYEAHRPTDERKDGA